MEEDFAKKMQVMLLGGWPAVDVTAEAYPVSIKLESLLRHYSWKKAVSNLQSNFLLGLVDERAFLNLPRRAI